MQVTLKNTKHCVSTDLSVFVCALFVQFIYEVVTTIFFVFVCALFVQVIYEVVTTPNLCVSTDLSVFLTVYPSQCVPYTVSQKGSSF